MKFHCRTTCGSQTRAVLTLQKMLSFPSIHIVFISWYSASFDRVYTRVLTWAHKEGCYGPITPMAQPVFPRWTHCPENAGPLMAGGEAFRQWSRAWLQLNWCKCSCVACRSGLSHWIEFLPKESFVKLIGFNLSHDQIAIKGIALGVIILEKLVCSIQV